MNTTPCFVVIIIDRIIPRKMEKERGIILGKGEGGTGKGSKRGEEI